MVNILQLTDTHFFEDPNRELYGVNTRASLQAVLRQVELSHIPYDLVLATGDLVHDETEAGYKALAQMFAGLAAPSYYLPGNHDAPHIMEKVLVNSTLDGFSVVVRGEWCIILLDSSASGQVEGYLSESILQRLHNELVHQLDRKVLIALHHHVVDVQSVWLDRLNLTNNAAFRNIVAAHSNVKAVINGHIHQELQVQQNGILYLGTPSTCFQFKPGLDKPGIDDGRPPGFRHILLNNDGSIVTRVHYVT
ncbi:MAG: 3',5'-cyclic-AMP phosphodiesterase [Gammaproteobacteria bacterium]|nr:3',5'-cyclic-AMP phosphodiesterase [Gammaproteobacteria bacterium]